MSNLRKQMELEMNLKGFTEKTKVAYIGYVRRYVEHFNRSPQKLGAQEIKTYLDYLITDKKASASHVNSTHSAIKFLYVNVMDQNWDLKKIPRAKKEKKFPVILTEKEVWTLLETVSNIKHKAILATVYSAGLRVSEVVHLKSCDIDSKSMLIRVLQGKGKKDRYTILSNRTLEVLRNYYKHSICRHSEWLFTGADYHHPISIRTVQMVFNQAKNAAGIKKKVTLHSLRHSFATHLLEHGTSIHHIQRLLGHTNINTTCVYLHLTRYDLMNVKSPFDLMDIDS